MSQQTRDLCASPKNKKPRLCEMGQDHVKSDVLKLQSRLNILRSKRLELVRNIKEYQSTKNLRWKNLAMWRADINNSDLPSKVKKAKIAEAREQVKAKIQAGAEKREAILAKIDRKIVQLEKHLRLLRCASPVTATEALRLATEDSDYDSSSDFEEALSDYLTRNEQRLNRTRAEVWNNADLICEITLFLGFGTELRTLCAAAGARGARKIRCKYLFENMTYAISARPGNDFLRIVGGLGEALATIASENSDNKLSPKITLKHPFTVSSQKLDAISNDMVELGGKEITSVSDNSGKVDWAAAAFRDKGKDEGPEIIPLADPLSETIMIHCDDGTLRFLSSWQYMSDQYVNFFMKWITRKEDQAFSTTLFLPVSFFDLIRKGPVAASVFTYSRSIHIFERKFILLPINDGGLTSSLCVIVNPGFIENEFMDEEDQDDDQNFPVILFFDALDIRDDRRKEKIGKQVRKWLNYEANRLGKFKEIKEGGRSDPFCEKTMEMFDPKVPHSTNLIDAGMYVCRYAYAIYLLRDKRFTYENAGIADFSPYFTDLITKSDEFNFDSEDIKTMGKEMNTLIGRLSAIIHLDD